MTDPAGTTQARHPWAAVRRTLLAVAGFCVVLAPILPDVVKAAGIATVPWVGGALLVAAAITRVLAIPAVEVWLRARIPMFAAAPEPYRTTAYVGTAVPEIEGAAADDPQPSN